MLRKFCHLSLPLCRQQEKISFEALSVTDFSCQKPILLPSSISTLGTDSRTEESLIKPSKGCLMKLRHTTCCLLLLHATFHTLRNIHKHLASITVFLMLNITNSQSTLQCIPTRLIPFDQAGGSRIWAPREIACIWSTQAATFLKFLKKER